MGRKPAKIGSAKAGAAKGKAAKQPPTAKAAIATTPKAAAKPEPASAPRADFLTTEQRSQRMSLIRGKDTGPEMLARRLVHGMGYRYRLHVASLPGKPDMVFPSRRKVIFVHGCFWHLHNPCRHYRRPSSRQDYWRDKLKANRARDRKHLAALSKLGWDCLVVWECEMKDSDALATRLREFLEAEA